ncbi:MAG: type III pantothenate kinase [Stomatobaculum sp.]|nr:type III pantothenate kinase [Stomatobaculum sp.]
MILAIDMGNSNIVIGGIDEKHTHFMERITTDIRKTDLEYAVSIKNIFEIHGLNPRDVEGAILSSVVPPLNPIIQTAVRKVTGMQCKLVGAGMKTGMNIRMDDPKKVGADLIVDSVAAKAEYPLPIIVIDMGTATTITVVDKHGDYIGGIIHPGLRVSLDTLSSRTAQLPHIDLESPGPVIAKNTVESMRSGILYGSASMMDGIIDRMEEELGCKASIVATGGLAPFVAPLCRHKLIVDDDLLLKGLLILYRKNS